jgi:type II secretory pathway component PulF
MFEFSTFIDRLVFSKVRLDIYHGLHGILNASDGARVPMWGTVFENWASFKRLHESRLANIFDRIAFDLREGKPLSEALRPFVPTEDYLLLEAGLVSNTLKQSFQNLIENFESSKEISKALIQGMVEPASSFFIFMALSIFSGLSVWDSLLSSFPIENWPAWCIPMINFQLFIGKNWVLLFLIVPLIYLYRLALISWTGSIRNFFDKTPLFSIYREKTGVVFLIVVSGLLASGGTFERCLELIKSKGSNYLNWHIDSILTRMSIYPSDVSAFLNTGLFNNDVLFQINNAAMTRNLSDTLRHIGSSAIKEVVASAKLKIAFASSMTNLFFNVLVIYYTAVVVLGEVVASGAKLAH